MKCSLGLRVNPYSRDHPFKCFAKGCDGNSTLTFLLIRLLIRSLFLVSSVLLNKCFLCWCGSLLARRFSHRRWCSHRFHLPLQLLLHHLKLLNHSQLLSFVGLEVLLLLLAPRPSSPPFSPPRGRPRRRPHRRRPLRRLRRLLRRRSPSASPFRPRQSHARSCPPSPKRVSRRCSRHSRTPQTPGSSGCPRSSGSPSPQAPP